MTAAQDRLFASHPRTPSRLDGVRPDRVWVRRDARQPRAELGNSALVEAIEWQHVRRGRKWTKSDQDTIDELSARAWQWRECNGCRLWQFPTWADELIPPRRTTGYTRFLAMLLAAYRSGAVGIVLGYHEVMALCGVSSESTWRKWCVEWERLGLVRIVQTWVRDRDPGEGRPRKYHKLFYRLGPAWENLAGPGLCENATSGDSEISKTWAARVAAGVRRNARARRARRRNALWAKAQRVPRNENPPSEPGGSRSEAPDVSNSPATAAAGPISPALRSRQTIPPSPTSGGRLAPLPTVGADEQTKELRPAASAPVSATPPPNTDAPTPHAIEARTQTPPRQNASMGKREARPACAGIEPASMPLRTEAERAATLETLARLAPELARFGVGLPPGLRLVERMPPPEPSRGPPGERCRACQGSGLRADAKRTDPVECPRCDGSGIEPPSEVRSEDEPRSIDPPDPARGLQLDEDPNVPREGDDR